MISYTSIKRSLYMWASFGLLLACQEPSEKPQQATEAFIEIYDSLLVPYTGNITLIAHAEEGKRFLFLDRKRGNLVETDDQGHILLQFSPIGETEELVGNTIQNLGYFQDSLIVVTSERGYYFYNRKGQYQRHLKDKTNPGSFWFRILHCSTSNPQKDYLLSVYRSSYSESTNFNDSKELIDRFQPITIKNLQDESVRLAFGYEKGSIFKQYDYHYNPDIFFDLDKYTQKIYILHNPEQTIYVYDPARDFALHKKLPISLAYFDLPVKQPFASGAYQASSMEMMRNSRYLNFMANKGLLLVSYEQGLSEQDAREVEIAPYGPALAFSLSKRYVSVYKDDGELLYSDVILPEKVMDVEFFENPERLLLSVNPHLQEAEAHAIFYLAKIASKSP